MRLKVAGVAVGEPSMVLNTIVGHSVDNNPMANLIMRRENRRVESTMTRWREIGDVVFRVASPNAVATVTGQALRHLFPPCLPAHCHRTSFISFLPKYIYSPGYNFPTYHASRLAQTPNQQQGKTQGISSTSRPTAKRRKQD